MTTILTFALTLFARCYQWRFKPRIVAITGNAGKTTTKDAIAAVLSSRYRVRAPAGNLNNELGIPLTILGDFADAYYRTGGTVGFWLKVFARATLGFWKSRSTYPELLVLEYGADRPGDIRRLARRFQPHIAVVTHVGQLPVHVEFFASPQELAAEKSQLVRALPADGTAVLNVDDQTVLDMQHVNNAHSRTFGGAEGADVQYTDVHVRQGSSGAPLGAAFNLTADGATMPVMIAGTLGTGIAAACAAAVAVGKVMGIGLADAIQELTPMRPPAGRMRILRGIKDSVIIDDTYNASPAATHLAIDTVRGLSGRKLLVLGDMRELGQHAPRAHQEIGSLAATVADELVCVGDGGRLMYEAASDQLASERLHWYTDSREAAPAVQRMVRPGDIVLVKGSQGVRMERIVQEIMAEPERAGELLVRQSARWRQK